jgi:hypothetical protein
MFFLIVILYALTTTHTMHTADHVRMNCGGIGLSAFIGFSIGLITGVITAAALTIPNPGTNPITNMALPLLVGAGGGTLCGTIPATIVYCFLKKRTSCDLCK